MEFVVHMFGVFSIQLNGTIGLLINIKILLVLCFLFSIFVTYFTT